VFHRRALLADERAFKARVQIADFNAFAASAAIGGAVREQSGNRNASYVASAAMPAIDDEAAGFLSPGVALLPLRE
jgi:hypothetical protein